MGTEISAVIRSLTASERTRGSRSILSGVTIAERGPAIVALVGESGSGKTATLRSLCGALRRGETLDAQITIQVDGTTMQPHALRTMGALAYVEQNASLLPWLSIRDNLLLPSRLNRALVAPSDSKMLQAIDDVGIALPGLARGDVLDSASSTLSGGQAQRLCLLRAFAFRPRLLLLDEAMGGLDPRNRHRVMQLIKSYVDESGAICVLTTHHHRECRDLATNVIALERGRQVPKEHVLVTA